jgi:FlaA1/EpsC-like NDP-sugar epimerase
VDALVRSTFAIRNRQVFVVDVFLVIVSVLGSFALRLDVTEFHFYFPAAWMMIAAALIVKIPTYYFFGLYRRLWIYASVNELKLIAVTVTTASVIVSAIMLALIGFDLVRPGMPRSALGIDWLLSIVLTGGFRFALRIFAEQSAPKPSGKSKRIIIAGAGSAGALVVRELQKNTQLNLEPIGFLDDDPSKHQHQIHGVPVIGKLSDLESILDQREVDEVIIAIPSAPGKVVRLVADACRKRGVSFRTMPGIYELLGGRVSVSRLREVDITDLLRRDPIRLNDEAIGAALSQKTVLVTGAGGSIGRELTRQIARWSPSRLILLGHGENSIFETLLELSDDYPTLEIIPIIADIRDRDRLKNIFNDHQPQVVFHAAAHKHVPLMESNPTEAITNNVIGTRNIVDVSDQCGVERFVLISTDKAVAPSNVYGATKRIAEMIVLDAAQRSQKIFTVVRFGNVLGSRGSIIPRFKRQIANGGPVTITHPGMERFFMTIPEAVYLVLQASTLGRGGDLFVLNMGQQVKIVDLAEDLIRLSGLEPGRDIEIIFTGIRPGEKLSEELWDDGTVLEKTLHPDIFRLPSRAESIHLAESIARLTNFVHADNADGIVRLLDEIVPGAHIRETPHPSDLTSIV